MASLQDSPYIDNFLDRSNAWVQRLTDLDYCLTRFQLVQRKWVYLEPIMGRGALPKETARYAQIDEEFRKLIGYLKVDNRVISLVNGMKGKALKDTLNNLQVCYNTLLNTSIFLAYLFLNLLSKIQYNVIMNFLDLRTCCG